MKRHIWWKTGLNVCQARVGWLESPFVVTSRTKFNKAAVPPWARWPPRKPPNPVVRGDMVLPTVPPLTYLSTGPISPSSLSSFTNPLPIAELSPELPSLNHVTPSTIYSTAETDSSSHFANTYAEFDNFMLRDHVQPSPFVLTSKTIESSSSLDRVSTNQQLPQHYMVRNFVDYVVQWIPYMRDYKQYKVQLKQVQNQLLSFCREHGENLISTNLHIPSILIAFQQIGFPFNPEVYLRLYGLINNSQVNEENVVNIVEVFLKIRKRLHSSTLYKNDGRLQSLLQAAQLKFEVFFKALCEEQMWLSESQLCAIVNMQQRYEFVSPEFFEMLGERINLRFDFFTEDQIGDFSRTLVYLKRIRERDQAIVYKEKRLEPQEKFTKLDSFFSQASEVSSFRFLPVLPLAENTISNQNGIDEKVTSFQSPSIFDAEKLESSLSFSSNMNKATIYFASVSSSKNISKVEFPVQLGTSLQQAFSAHLPYVLHEYKYWNLIDLAEMYLVFKIDDEEMTVRFGIEAWKHVLAMKYGYPAKALKVLAFLETSDARTFRSLIRNVPRVLGFKWKADFIAETLLACALIGHTDGKIYQRMSQYLQQSRIDQISTPTLLCDLVAALAKINRSEITLFHHIVKRAEQQPTVLHMEHLISLARDFALLDFFPANLMALMTLPLRVDQLKECSPSAVTYIPLIIHAWCQASHDIHTFFPLLQALVEVVCYDSECLQRPPSFYLDKDQSWANIRENHTDKLALTDTFSSSAFSLNTNPAHALPMTVDEAILLLRGLDQLGLRSEEVLEIVANSILKKWEDVTAAHLPALLHGFGNLSFTSEILMNFLEKTLLKYAAQLTEAEVIACLWGSYMCGITGNSPAFQTLLLCLSHRNHTMDPFSLEILQILAMCLRIDGREHFHHQRIPEAVARFCTYIENEFTWEPMLLSSGLLFQKMQIVSQSLRKRKIPHYQNHPFYPFTIPIAIPDQVFSSTKDSKSISSLCVARFSQDWTVHEVKEHIIAPSSNLDALNVSSFGVGSTSDNALINLTPVSSRDILDMPSSSSHFPFKLAYTHRDGCQSKEQGTALFFVDNTRPIQLHDIHIFANASTSTSLNTKHETQRRLTGYARLRERVLGYMGWRVAYLSDYWNDGDETTDSL